MARKMAVSLTTVMMALLVMAVMIPQAVAKRYLVGGPGWTTNVSYRKWAYGKNFYKGDWLFFVYDRNKANVLEVNKANFAKCISRNPIHNWTLGAGRDVVPLNVTKTYYFISGKGLCSKGVRVAITVKNPVVHKNST